VVSWVGRGMGVLDGSTCPKQKGIFWVFFSLIGLNGVFSVFLKQKCIRLVREKLTICPYFVYDIEVAFLRNLIKCKSDFTKKSRLAAICSEVSVAITTIALSVAPREKLA